MFRTVEHPTGANIRLKIIEALFVLIFYKLTQLKQKRMAHIFLSHSCVTACIVFGAFPKALQEVFLITPCWLPPHSQRLESSKEAAGLLKITQLNPSWKPEHPIFC